MIEKGMGWEELGGRAEWAQKSVLLQLALQLVLGSVQAAASSEVG